MSWQDQRPDDAMVGAFDAVAPVSVNAVDSGPFREAMSRLGAAVHVVTTDGPAGKTGFTATAVVSVSDNPPTILVCLNRKSAGGPIIADNGVFCVNTLSVDAQGIADVFAGRTGQKGTERFNTGNWTTLTTGSPALAAAIVACDCRVIEIKAVASHNVIFAVVEAIAFGPEEPALVYHARSYKAV